MKKIIYLTTILAVFAIGCKKETKQEVKPVATPVNVKDATATENNPDDDKVWCACQNDCVATTEKVCCERPAKVGTVMTNMFTNFIGAFNGNTIPAFFSTENFAVLWPNLASNELAIVAGLQNGTNKIILFTNPITNTNNYLIGLSSQTYTQIYNSPLYTIN